MNVRRAMVFVQVQDDAEPADKLLHASGQMFGGLRVDGLSPEHVGEVLQRQGAELQLVVGDIERQEAGGFGDVLLAGASKELVRQVELGASILWRCHDPGCPLRPDRVDPPPGYSVADCMTEPAD